MFRRSTLCIGALLAVLALAIVATASARTVRPRWTEQKQLNRGKVLFQVRLFSYDDSGWRVRVRIINRSPFPIRQTNDNKTRPPYYLGGFQIYSGRQRRPFFATSVTPVFPDPLKPGATWVATLSGTDVLVRGARYKVAFGYFLSPPESGYYGFYWVTNHTIRA